MSDIAEFYRLLKTVEENEKIKKQVKETLKFSYKSLVQICPHSEAIDWNFGNRSGDYRVCKICGLEDLASQGGTPGDEYDYGYPGYPNREFWKNTTVTKAKTEKEFWSYRRGHGWRVRDGKLHEMFGEG